MDKIYNILLDDKKIGTTKLEYGDPPMGVVFGEISFIDIATPYDFFKSYCETNKITFTDYADDKMICCAIPNLKVADDKGNEIRGLDGDVFATNTYPSELTIFGIAYPFYEDEFPHHVKAYEERLNRLQNE
ncbi:hypothetical protein [Chryseolinea soli]|uniref:Uncharacterized protein n=1 Tax=Chryseolinea soli TaxID=2321403 RepID=A0A385SHA9_9BACT|nr:hypothetical protein [Chryseolinea soli]AYB30314.1 hypothetical protein D4L85_06790 [Chryseolinea soli]